MESDGDSLVESELNDLYRRQEELRQEEFRQDEMKRKRNESPLPPPSTSPKRGRLEVGKDKLEFDADDNDDEELPFEMERLVVVLEDVDNTRETAFHGPLTDLDSPSECRRKFSREVSWPGDLQKKIFS